MRLVFPGAFHARQDFVVVEAEGFDLGLGAVRVVKAAVLERATSAVATGKVPPQPRLASLLGLLEHAELPFVLLDDLSTAQCDSFPAAEWAPPTVDWSFTSECRQKRGHTSTFLVYQALVLRCQECTQYIIVAGGQASLPRHAFRRCKCLAALFKSPPKQWKRLADPGCLHLKWLVYLPAVEALPVRIPKRVYGAVAAVMDAVALAVDRLQARSAFPHQIVRRELRIPSLLDQSTLSMICWSTKDSWPLHGRFKLACNALCVSCTMSALPRSLFLA